MDTELPALICDQCGEPVWPADSYKAPTLSDATTGEPAGIPGVVVHEDCWSEWAEAHDVPATD